MAGTPNKGIIHRGPFSKVNTSDIKSPFWSEMKQNFNAAPSTTYFCSLLQDKLIKDQWELYVYFVCLLRLEGTSANVMHLSTIMIWLPPNPQSICWCLQRCVIIILTNHKKIFLVYPQSWHRFMYRYHNTQAFGRSLCPTASVAVIKWRVTLS